MGLVVFALLNCSSCVTDQKVIDSQIRALNEKVDHLKEITEMRFNSDVDTKLAAIREQQADTEVRIGKLMTEIQKLSGKFDENNRLVQNSSERDLNEQENLKMFLTEMDKRLNTEEKKTKELYTYLGLEPSFQPSQEKTSNAFHSRPRFTTSRGKKAGTGRYGTARSETL